MFGLVAVALVLGTDTGDPQIDARARQDYNHLRMPAHGTIYKGMLYGFFDDDWAIKNSDGSGKGGRSSPELEGIPTDKTAKKNWKPFPLQLAGYNCRHHVGFGALWFSCDTSFLNRWEFDHIQEIWDSRLGRTDALGRDAIISGINLFRLMGKFPSAKTAAFDSVPITKDSCKTFLLEKKASKFEIWESQGAVFQKIGPNKTPTVIKNLETLDSPFTEDFYAFVRKNDYYFVTESGKLYHAPPLKEGKKKTRTMKALWEDAKRPIVAVIEDADHDRVWLFAKDKTAGAKGDLFFEMKGAIQTESFDAAKLRTVDVEGRAKLLLEYLPLIRNAK